MLQPDGHHQSHKLGQMAPAPERQKTIYHLLVRSVMEYASFTYHLMTDRTQKSIDEIHHTALRVIFKQKRENGNVHLLSIANGVSMKVRLDELKGKYLSKAVKNRSTLIVQLV